MTDIPVNENDAVVVVVATADLQAVYAFDFLAYEATHLKAIKTALADGAETDLIAGTDFGVSGLSNPSGGQITLNDASAIVIGDKITIYRDVPIERLADFAQSGDYQASVVNREEDLQIMMLQEMRRESDRGYKAALGETGGRIERLAEGRFHIADANGNLVDGGSASEITSAQGYAEDAEGFRDEAEVFRNDASNSVGYAAEWAIKPEDSAVSASAGGNGSDTFSALHWAAKAALSASQISTASLVSTYGASIGAADNTAEITAAINSGQPVIDLERGTYAALDNIVGTTGDIELRNGTLDFSNLPDLVGSPDEGLSFRGTRDAAINLSADAAAGDFILSLPSTATLSAGQLLTIRRDEKWKLLENEIAYTVRIKDIDSSTQVTLMDPLKFDFPTANNAQILAHNSLKNIKLTNVRIIGNNLFNQANVTFEVCDGVTVFNSHFEKAQHSGIRLLYSVDVAISSNLFNEGKNAGLAYGVVVSNGCDGVRAINNTSYDLRHFLATGGSEGLCDNVIVSSNSIYGSRDAGVDSHPPCLKMTITNNTIVCGEDDGSADGITTQALENIVTGNNIKRAGRTGILAQTLFRSGTVKTIISNNIIEGGQEAGTSTGISLANDAELDAVIDGAIITDNQVLGEFTYGVYLHPNGGDINNTVIANNTLIGVLDRGVYLRADNNKNLLDTIISNNIIKMTGGAGVYLTEISGSTLLGVNITGNIISGGSFGIRGIAGGGIYEADNKITASVDPYEMAAEVTDINLNYNGDKMFKLDSSSARTLKEHEDHIICDRGSTITLTLPDPAVYLRREITVQNIRVDTVISASANVVPIDSETAGTAILPGIAGSWCKLLSDGTDWLITQSG